MVTKTSLSAIRALMYIAASRQTILKPRQIAEVLGESPTYLAKVLNSLVKAGILQATRGMKGGVQLNREPARITLQSILEACQGIIVGNYCQTTCEIEITCAYHQASVELQEAIVNVLQRWNLAHLTACPLPLQSFPDGNQCRLLGVKPPMRRARDSKGARS